MSTDQVISTASFQELKSCFPRQLVQPFYHMINDHDVAYVKHLYTFRNVAGFEADLDFLLQEFTPVDLHAVREAKSGGAPLPDHSFFLSFDDGFRELYEIVLPILKKKGIPATFFLNKNFMDNKEFFYRNKASLLIEHFLTNKADMNESRVKEIIEDNGLQYTSFKPSIKQIEYYNRHLIDEVAAACDLDFQAFLKSHQPYLTTEQVKSMIDDGFTIGAHSVDHAKYCTVTLDEQIRQTEESMDFVADKFNLDYRVFAFPFHDNDVSTAFFDHIHGNDVVELSFGTAEMIEDQYPRNIQRQWFENTEMSAEDLLALRYSEKQERIENGKDAIRRPYGDLRQFTVNGLKNAIETNEFWKGDGPIPITKYRARAHVRNPRSNPHDLSVMTMYLHDDMVGYLGVLPGKLYINDEIIPWGWLTCWWTNPDHSGKGIGMAIINKIHEVMEGRIGCSEFTALGKKAAEKSGLLKPLIIPGKIFHFDSENWTESDILNEYSLEYISEVDGETDAFIEANRRNELCRKTGEELTWMIQNPWVLGAPFKDRTSKRIFFSSVSERFMYQAFKVFDSNNRLVSFVILRIRDNKIIVPYFYSTGEKAHIQAALEVILEHARAYNVVELKCHNDQILKAMESTQVPISKVENHNKYCFFSHTIDLKNLEGLHVQDGDGDNGFT